jgi:SmpA / OmlA family
MILFATPDFGAGGLICGALGIVWLIVLLFVLAGSVKGVRLLKTDARCKRLLGILVILASAATPLLCCFGPREVVRINYGNYPLGAYPNGKIKKGMSQEDVIEVLGTPHERINKADGETWCYWLDSFGMGLFWVYFDANGRVIGAYGN